MKKIAVILGVLAVLGIIALILVAVAGGSYNRLVKLSQAVDSQWAQVQNVYQRRADLIPNLVATVSGAANFEKSTLTEITAGPRLGRTGEARPQQPRRPIRPSWRRLTRRRGSFLPRCPGCWWWWNVIPI